MKVFISGPMSGKPNFNREAFFKAQEELEKLGYSVWNPAWLAYPSDTEFSKDAIHAIDNEALRHCDAIYMLKGWKYSEGARNEYKIAIARDLDIMYEEELCYSFRFNLSKETEKNTPVFDKEFALDEEIKNRTNYQLEAIKENVKEKYNTLDRRIKSIEEELAWDKWKNDLPHNFCSNRIDSLEKWRNDFAECYTVNITKLRKEVEAIKESIGTDNLQEQLEKDFADVYTEFQNTKDKVNDIEFGYINWSSKMSSAIDEMEKVKDTVKGLNSLVATLGERNGILSDKLDDYKEAYMHLDNADEALDRRIKYLENGVCDIRRADKALESSIKAMNDRMNLFSRELDSLSTAIDMRGKDIGSIVQERCDDNRTINNMINDLNIRLKAIEKRLSIKPFYEPTEDEKDDD